LIPFQFEPTDGEPGGSRILDKALERLMTSFDSLRRLVTNDNLVRVTFPGGYATDVIVRHGLPAPPVSWEIVDKTADINVWRSPTVTARRDVLILQASAAGTVTIRVT
jgi:hypothetical protein